MKITGKTRKIMYASAGLAILGIFVLYWPVKLVQRTSTPEFCETCHIHETQYQAWFMTGVHRNISCVDCHLPNNNPVNHLLWKGIDGIKDLIFFHSNFFREPVVITSHGKNTIQENCTRCHAEMVSRIRQGARNCWLCHRRINHNFPGMSQ